MELEKRWKLVKDDITSLLKSEADIVDLLTEDMFQAESGNLIIDSGWYTDTFISFLIKDNNWESPVIKIYSSNLKDTYIAIKSIEYYCENSEVNIT